MPASLIPYPEMQRAGLLPVDLLTSRLITLDEVSQGFDALEQGLVAQQLIRF